MLATRKGVHAVTIGYGGCRLGVLSGWRHGMQSALYQYPTLQELIVALCRSNGLIIRASMSVLARISRREYQRTGSVVLTIEIVKRHCSLETLYQ